ncbi:MAG: MoxR family ATPase [Acidobacteriota bacterium]
MFESIEKTLSTLESHGYVADAGVATSLFLALRMGKALFLEGEPGVGKTELAKVVAEAQGAELIRLQCYEGLDVQQAVYDWNYPRQLLAIQARGAGVEANDGRPDGALDDLYTEDYLLRRPLLRALDPAASPDRPPVLLIDELDRADEEFESFLLELLSDFQITIPEIGTLRPERRPVVFLTSNRTREIHDALKRRCVFQWIDYPSAERELEIVRAKLPTLDEHLLRSVVAFVQAVRGLDLDKRPGVAETLDWAEALSHLGTERLDPLRVEQTLGFLLKYQDDVDQLRGEKTKELLAEPAPATRGAASG